LLPVITVTASRAHIPVFAAICHYLLEKL
jgi:hypothetical protein